MRVNSIDYRFTKNEKVFREELLKRIDIIRGANPDIKYGTWLGVYELIKDTEPEIKSKVKKEVGEQR